MFFSTKNNISYNENLGKLTFSIPHMVLAHASQPHITIYDTNYKKMDLPYDKPRHSGNSVAFSPSGKYMAIAHSGSHGLSVYNVLNNFAKVSDLTIDLDSGGRDVAFSSDGKYLAVGYCDPPYLSLFDVSLRFKPVRYGINRPIKSNTWGISFSADSRFLAVGQERFPYLSVFEVKDGYLKHVKLDNLPTHGAGCRRVKFSSCGNWLAFTHTAPPFLHVYKIKGDSFVKVDNCNLSLPGSGAGLSFSIDSKYLAVRCSEKPYLVIYDILNNFKVVDIPENVVGEGFKLAFSTIKDILVVSEKRKPFLSLLDASKNFNVCQEVEIEPIDYCKGMAFCPITHYF